MCLLATRTDFLGKDFLVFEVGLIGSILGLAAVGPLILAVQWLRGRRVPLGPGEVLWIAPLVVFLVALGLCSLPGGISSGWNLMVCCGWVHTQLLMSLFSLILLFLSNDRWTERLGSLSCTLVGVAIVANLVLHPLEI
jgi:hypothetical protein